MTQNSRIEAVERATGRTWDEWLAYMAGIGAERLTHHEIAAALVAELDGTVDNLGWWAQATAVAYEQYMGRRVPGQRPDGTFQTSVSRSNRITWRAKARDGAAIVVISEPKKDGTAPLVAQHIGSATMERNDEAKTAWTAISARFLGTL